MQERVRVDLANSKTPCRFYLCEEMSVASQAYKLQGEGTPDAVLTSTEALQGLLQRDPASAQRWGDLGDVLAQQGLTRDAEYCFGRALELGGTSADVLVSAGEFYLRHGGQLQGLHYLRRVLALTSTLDDAVFSRFDAREVPVEVVLSDGLPEGDKRAAQAYLRYSMEQNVLGDARTTWRWIVTRGFADERLSVAYSQFLVGQKLYQEAMEAWAAALTSKGSQYGTTEFLYNASLKKDPVPGAVFDWNLAPAEHVSVVREASSRPAGWQLRVGFDGMVNLEFHGISQKTVVPPGNYKFRASVRTDQISTDQGVFFRIADAEAGNRLSVETERLTGSHDWNAVESTFSVGVATHLLEVSLMRRPSLRFDNRISGTIWIERMSLERI